MSDFYGLVATTPGLLERITNLREDDINAYCGGSNIPGKGKWQMPFAFREPQHTAFPEWGREWEWVPPAGVDALGTMTRWQVLPDDFPDPVVLRTNRLEIVAALSTTLSEGVHKILLMIEAQKHPLIRLAEEAPDE